MTELGNEAAAITVSYEVTPKLDMQAQRAAVPPFRRHCVLVVGVVVLGLGALLRDGTAIGAGVGFVVGHVMKTRRQTRMRQSRSLGPVSVRADADGLEISRPAERFWLAWSWFRVVRLQDGWWVFSRSASERFAAPASAFDPDQTRALGALLRHNGLASDL